MKIQRIVLISILVLLAVLPFVVRHYRAKMTREIISERPVYIPIEEVLPVHEQRIKDRIALLKKQSLDETFVELLEDQQYFYPGYHPPGGSWGGEGQDLERLLSARSFLKVLQQFNTLSREQAIEKLHVFCKRAINSLEESSMLPNGNPASVSFQSKSISLTGAKNMICATMLLAARMGEHKLLLNQIDEMQRIIDICVERAKKSDTIPLVLAGTVADVMSLDDDCVLTTLMYALKRAGVADIPFEETFSKKMIPLYRWDAPLTYYDFEVGRTKKLDSKDAVEQFVVYAFTGNDRFDRQKRKHIIDTLKERLSK